LAEIGPVSNQRAKALLEAAGLAYEYEPTWVEGRKPDFYCSGRHVFWCEVKTFERLDDFKKLDNAILELRKRVQSLAGRGRGIAYVSDGLTARDAKVVMRLLKRALSRFDDIDAPDRVVALVPRDPDYGEFVKFSLAIKDHLTVEIHSCAAGTGKYGIPMDMRPDPTDQTTLLRFSSGGEDKIATDDFLRWNDGFRAAVVACPDPAPFEVMAMMQTGGLRRLKNPERIRNALKDANDQLKNGLRYKGCPCLLMIFHDGLDVPDNVIVKSALYGNLTYVFPKGNAEASTLTLASDGAWNPDKHRATSAVMYVRNGAPPVIIHNYWALHPFPQGVFHCKEIVALDDGTFNEIDYSSNQLWRWAQSQASTIVGCVLYSARQIRRLMTRAVRAVVKTSH
jgi:hypothetical protein